MSLLAATAAYPAVLLALGLGAGLLTERAGGWTLPPGLLLAAGVAALVVVAQLTTLRGWSAPATPWVLLVVGAAGLVTGRRRLAYLARGGDGARWVALSVLLGYLAAIAGVVLAGRPTFLAYLADTTNASHVSGTDWLLHHGRDVSGASGDSSWVQYLRAYYGASYPSGGHTLYGGIAQLVPGVWLPWLFQPYMATILAVGAAPMTELLRRLGLGIRAASVAGALAAIPALVYAYDLVGSIKELTAIPAIVGIGLLVGLGRDWLTRGARAVVPFAVLVAAGIAAVGPAFFAWALVGVFGLMCVAAGLLADGRVRALGLVPPALALTVLVAVLAVPTLSDLGAAVNSTRGIEQTSDPGNLLQPIHASQVMGVWLNAEYRTDPVQYRSGTLILIGVALVALALGVVNLVRRRQLALLAWLAGQALLWWYLTRRGSTWTDAKLVLLSSPLAALLVWSGVAGLVASHRRIEAWLLGGAVAMGVIGSAALLVYNTRLAPTDRFEELRKIGDHLAADGPTLLPDFDEYALYSLRRSAPSGPGFAFWPRDLGISLPYGKSVQLDELDPNVVLRRRFIVARRRPEQSRPPAGFRLAEQRRFYEVWERTSTPHVMEHLALGGDASALGVPACARVRSLAATAERRNATLVAAARPASVVLRPADAVPRSFPSDGSGGIVLNVPGEISLPFTVTRPGPQRIWLRGDIVRRVEVLVDGRPVGTVGGEPGPDGNVAGPLRANLGAGPHTLRLARPGGSPLRPGDGNIAGLSRIVVEPVGPSRLLAVPPRRAEAVLCGRPLDWIDVVAR